MTLTKPRPLTGAQINANFRTVRTRGNGICEGCGDNKATIIYRRTRAECTIANLMHICIDCWQLAQTPLGPTLGWRIVGNHNPADVPVWRRNDSTWHHHLDDGDREPMNPCDAIEYLVLVGAMKKGLE